MRKEFPFELKIPNDETLQVMKDINEEKNLESYDDIDEMFRALKS